MMNIKLLIMMILSKLEAIENTKIEDRRKGMISQNKDLSIRNKILLI